MCVWAWVCGCGWVCPSHLTPPPLSSSEGTKNEFQSELQRKLKKRKDSNTIMEEDEGEDDGLQIGPLLPFDANEGHTQKWLNTYGYQRYVWMGGACVGYEYNYALFTMLP